MDFSYSEEQLQVKDLAAQILGDMATPDRQRDVEKQGERFDAELWSTLAEAGILGVAIDENYGGMGFGLTELCMVIEQVGVTTAPVPVIPVLVSAALPLQAFGSKTQKANYLPDVVAGTSLLTAALMEVQNEDPSKPVLTRAEAKGDGLVLNGQKLCVPFADRAERILLSAKTANGVAVVLLDPKAAGVTLNALVSTTAEPQFELLMDNVDVGADDIISLDQGESIMQWTAERTTAALCAMQLGLSEKAMRMTATYTGERKQFDVPIATFQAVAHRAADCYMDVECLRLVTEQAISLLDDDAEASMEVLIAKYWAGDAGHRVSYATQHLHGGMGIDRDYPLWRYSLLARQIEMTLGNSSTALVAIGSKIAAGDAYVK